MADYATTWDDDRQMCPRCSKDRLCCEMDRVDCWDCGGEGVSGHDCGEDCCPCLDPEENVVCETCNGKGGWWHCPCDANGVHAPTPAREKGE